MYRCAARRFAALSLAAFLAFSLLSFPIFADGYNPLLSVTTTTSNNSSANPDDSTFGSQATSSVSPLTVISSGAHNRINRFNIRTDGITSTHFFIRADFTVVTVKSQGMQSATIDDLFPVSISGYNTNHTVPVTVSDTNYSVRCYDYMLGEYLGDFGNIWISGVSEQYVVRGNKTISFLIEVTAPAVNTTNNLTLTLNTPITLYHTVNRADTLHLIPTQVAYYSDYSEVLFSYLVSIRNDLDQAEFDLAGIWQYLVDHEADIEQLGKLNDILGLLTSVRSDVMAIRQSILQLFTSNSTIPQFQWRYTTYTVNPDDTITVGEASTNWYMAVLQSLRNLDLVTQYFVKDRILEKDAEDAGLVEFAQEGFEKAGDSIDDISSMLDITDMGSFNASAMGTAGEQSFLDWFSSHNAQMIDAVPQSRGPADSDFVDFLTPHLEEIDAYLQEGVNDD